MRNRAQRRQYGESVVRLALSIRFGLRCSLRCERKLVNMSCSGLHIRHRRAHVPRSTLPVSEDHGKRDGPPVKALQQTGLSVASLPLVPAAERRYVSRTGGTTE